MSRDYSDADDYRESIRSTSNYGAPKSMTNSAYEANSNLNIDPQAGMDNYMAMMQNMMNMYMQNPQMQQEFNSQFMNMMQPGGQMSSLHGNHQKQTALGRAPPQYEQNNSSHKNDLMIDPSRSSTGSRVNVAGKINQMFQEEAEDLDNFYNTVNKSPRVDYHNNYEMENSRDHADFRASRYDDYRSSNYHHDDHYNRQLENSKDMNGSLLLHAESEFVPFRGSLNASLRNSYNHNILDDSRREPSGFRNTQIHHPSNKDHQNEHYNNDGRGYKNSFQESIDHSMRKRSPEDSRHFNQSYLREIEEDEQSVKDAARIRHEYDNHIINKPTATTNHGYDEDRPIKPMGGGNNRSEDEPSYDEAPVDKAKLKPNKPKQNNFKLDHKRGFDDAKSPDTRNKEEEEDNEESFHTSPPPDYINYQNNHDKQKISGVPTKTFEELLAEEIKRAEAMGEQVVADNIEDEHAKPVKKNFLKRGARKAPSALNRKPKTGIKKGVQKSVADDNKKIGQSRFVSQDTGQEVSPIREDNEDEEVIEIDDHEENILNEVRKYNVEDYLKPDSKINEDKEPLQHNTEQKPSESVNDHEEEDLNKFDDQEEWDDKSEGVEVITKQETEEDSSPSGPTKGQKKMLNTYFKSSEKSKSKDSKKDSQPLAPSEEEIVKKYVNDKIESLNAEISKFKAENEKLKLSKRQVNEERKKIEKERADMEEDFKAEDRRLKAKWEEEMKKVKREKKIAERNHKAIASMPNRKEREEIDALNALIAELQEELKSKDKKHKFTVDRQKKLIAELEKKNQSLSEEIIMYEQLRLKQKDTSEVSITRDRREKKPSEKRVTVQARSTKSVKSTKRTRARVEEEYSRPKSVLNDDENIEDFEKMENIVEEDVYNDDGENDHDIDNEESNHNHSEHEDDATLKLEINPDEYDYTANKYYQRYLDQQGVVLRVADEQISNKGKIQRTYVNGKKEVIFSNGAKREVDSF